MINKAPCPPGTKYGPVTYSFLRPARLRIRDADGKVTLVGYGIGEQITVLEPTVQYLITSHELLDEIPLANGGAIIEWPADMEVKWA